MARPKSFDPDVALEKAMHVFWKNGFQGASMPLLTKSMGIHPGNLYSNYGNKENLFFRSIQLYQKNQRLEMIHFIKANSLDPLSCLKGLLSQMMQAVKLDEENKGCLMINAFLEIHIFNAKIKEKITAHFSDMRRIFENLINEAKDYGQISKYRDTEGMASMILNSLVGVHVFQRHPTTIDQSEILYAELIENLR